MLVNNRGLRRSLTGAHAAGCGVQFATNHLRQLRAGARSSTTRLRRRTGAARRLAQFARRHLASPVVFEDRSTSSRAILAEACVRSSLKTANVLFWRSRRTRSCLRTGSRQSLSPRCDRRQQPLALMDPSRAGGRAARPACTRFHDAPIMGAATSRAGGDMALARRCRLPLLHDCE